MKISNLNSTLSCILKCLRFSLLMIRKKIIFGMFLFIFMASCSSPTAMLGPAYTFTSSGNILQTGLSYGTNEMITAHTGKTPIENIQEISSLKYEETNNIKKKTLESEDFYYLVKSKIQKANKILINTNQ